MPLHVQVRKDWRAAERENDWPEIRGRFVRHEANQVCLMQRTPSVTVVQMLWSVRQIYIYRSDDAIMPLHSVDRAVAETPTFTICVNAWTTQQCAATGECTTARRS